MAYKTVLTVLTDSNETAEVLPKVATFAAAAGAHLEVMCLGIDRTQTGYYVAGAAALMHEETLAQAQQEAQRIAAQARMIMGRLDLGWSLQSLIAQAASVSEIVARAARFADLVILPKPYGPDAPPDAPVLVEAAMFQGQAPVLVLGGAMTPSPAPQKAVIAWNDSAESLAAVRKALPLLTAAQSVSLCIVGPQRHDAAAADPGSELAQMLTRHGASVDIALIPQTLPRVSEVIARHAADVGADLLVMGAYGHSRFREAILGGATRNTLESAELPVLMAH